MALFSTQKMLLPPAVYTLAPTLIIYTLLQTVISYIIILDAKFWKKLVSVPPSNSVSVCDFLGGGRIIHV